MKSFLKNLGVFALALIAIFVNAWAYQVFWNDVILNVCQIFTKVDIINILKVPYGACVAFVAGIGLITQSKTENNKEYKEMILDAIGKILTKVIWIGVVLLIVSIVF